MNLTCIVFTFLLGISTVSLLQEKENNFNKLERLRTKLRELPLDRPTHLTERYFLTNLLGKLSNTYYVNRVEKRVIEQVESWLSNSEDLEGSGVRVSEELIRIEDGEGDDEWDISTIYNFIVTALQNIAHMPFVLDILNSMLQDMITKVPLETINEVVDLVPWQGLDEAISNPNDITVGQLKNLYEDFKPVVEKIVELYHSSNETLVAALKTAIRERIKELTVFSYQHKVNNSPKLQNLKSRLETLNIVNPTKLSERNFLTYLLNKLSSSHFVDMFGDFMRKLKYWSSNDPEEVEGSVEYMEEFMYEDDESAVYSFLQYLGLTGDTFITSYLFYFTAAPYIPVMVDLANSMLQDVLAKLPLETINELVDLVPWQSLDSTLKSSDNTSLEKLGELLDDFRPLVNKVLELLDTYFTSDEALVAALKSTIQTRIETLTTEEKNCSSKKVVCYYPNWAFYRKGMGRFDVDDIDTSLCTHFIYAFAVLDRNQLLMKPQDSFIDVDRSGGFGGWRKGFYRRFTDLKRQNPGAKFLVSLGGFQDSSHQKYSDLLASPDKIDSFAKNALEFVKEYGFDGLDLHYEYPTYDGHGRDAPDSDRPGFTLLCKKLSETFRPWRLEVSAAVSASEEMILAGYEVPQVCHYLDSVHVMAYDLHGPWEENVNHHSPLYDEIGDKLSLDHGAGVWLENGCPREKLVLGIPTYGRSWTLSSLSDYKVHALAEGGGEGGPVTRVEGFLAYYEICRLETEGWTKVSDPSRRTGPYAYKDNQWVSYDDMDMVTVKANYINNNEFGGAMIWDLTTDDFQNLCGQGRFPLTSTVSQIVKSQTLCSAPRHL